jgi:hypothetical protein
MIETANRQCKLYCQRTRKCSCGSQGSFEIGFVKFLTNDLNSSKHHLHEFLLSPTLKEHENCQTILKTLVILTIHLINKHDSERDIDAQVDTIEYFQTIAMDLKYDQLDPMCYVSVIKEILL